MEFNEEELREEDRVMDPILDEVVEVQLEDNIQDFRLKLSPDYYNRFKKQVKYFANYRSLKNEDEEDNNIELYICMGIRFYVSVDDSIEKSKLSKMVNGKDKSHKNRPISFKEITKPTKK